MIGFCYKDLSIISAADRILLIFFHLQYSILYNQVSLFSTVRYFFFTQATNKRVFNVLTCKTIVLKTKFAIGAEEENLSTSEKIGL